MSALGDKLIPPIIGNPYNGYINPYYWVDEFIPYYKSPIMGSFFSRDGICLWYAKLNFPPKKAAIWGHRNPTLLMRRVVTWRKVYTADFEEQGEQSKFMFAWNLEVTWQLKTLIYVHPFLSMFIHIYACSSIFNRKNTFLRGQCFPTQPCLPARIV